VSKEGGGMLFRNRPIILVAVACWVQVAVVSLGLSAEPGGERVSMPKRGICAHRGASDTHPENTLAAFHEAIRLGAAMIEFDVALSRDGQLVLMHDSTVDRTTNGKGSVSQLTLEELKKLDAGTFKAKHFGGVNVPTLDEALAMMPENIWLNVHLKEASGQAEKLAEQVTGRIVAHRRLHQSFLACGTRAAAAARRADARIKICNMQRQANSRKYVDETISAKTAFIQLLGGETVDPAHTRLLKQHRVRINYCCANEAEKVARLFEAGVEFPLVDRVRAMIAVAEQQGIARLLPVYRSRLKREGLKTPLSTLLEQKVLVKGAANQGLALGKTHNFASNAATICRFDKNWKLIEQKTIRIEGVNHFGAIDYHDGFLWAGLLHGPEGGQYDKTLDRGKVVKIRANDLSVVRTWDITKDLTWIDPVCFDGTHLWIGDLRDQGIHRYRFEGDRIVRDGTFRYPGGMHFSQGVRIAGGKLYSIHTFGSMDGLFEFNLPSTLDKTIQQPTRVWEIAETRMHLEGFDFVPGHPDQIWHSQGGQVDRYRLAGVKALAAAKLRRTLFPVVSRQPAVTRVRVTDLGAVADGKTDCLAAIRKAIAKVAAAGGGTVVFPRAKQPYLVSGTILIEASNITLSGPDATIKLADGAANGTKEGRSTESQVHVLRVAGKPDKPVERIEIRGLTVDANIYRQNDYYNPRAIVIEHGHRVKVRDVTILRPFVGLDIGAGSSDCEVRGCVIEDWLEDGFDASGDADKGSGAITTNIRFIDCHARGAPKSTGNAWEIEDGVRHVRVIDCSVTDVPRGNAFGIRNHWKAGPVDISRDIQLRGVRIERVGGKYGIYSHSAPRDKFPRNRVADIGLYDVHCLAPVMLAGQLESVRIVGGRYGVIHLGWDYGSKSSREPGGPLPLLETRISIRNVRVRGLNINATAGRFTLSNVLVDASGESALPYAVRIVGGGDRVRLSNCTITGAGKVGVALLDEAAPRIVDSIIWGNPLAVGLGSGQPTFSHCCLQGGVPRGAGDRGDNLASDPRFQVVAERRFLLRHTVAGDVTASPCIDAGSRLAAAGGLDERTTRSDRVRDTLQVDLGFHYPLKSAD
jgi:glycerophosphoryl diester phosphodiesterase